jgi:trimethylamine corrinoid protein
MPMSIRDGIAELDEAATLKTVTEALAAGQSPLSIADEAAAGLQVVGQRFEKQEYFLSELIIGAEIFREAMELVQPHLTAVQTSGRQLGDVVIGTVKGDIHDLGKNMVCTMLSASGYVVHDLGVDVPTDKFVQSVRDLHPKVLGLSGLLTVSFDAMRDTIDALKAAGLRDRVKVMVGGGPVDERVAEYAGADAVGRNAMEAVDLVRRLSGGAK